MPGVLIIFRREVGQYFTSPVAYLIATAFFLVTGLVYNNDLTISLTMRPTDPAAVPVFLSFAVIFFAPLLTMRMLAEEQREGTLELLLTAPVRDSDIVLGKFISAWFFYSLMLVITFIIYNGILVAIPTYTPDLGHAVAAYMGIWLYGGAALAVGLMFSAMTENQIVAAFLSISALLLLWLGDLIGQIAASIELANFVRKLTLQGHFSTSFAWGLFRAEDAVFFVGIIAVTLFITIRIVESRRWR